MKGNTVWVLTQEFYFGNSDMERGDDLCPPYIFANKEDAKRGAEAEMRDVGFGEDEEADYQWGKVWPRLYLPEGAELFYNGKMEDFWEYTVWCVSPVVIS